MASATGPSQFSAIFSGLCATCLSGLTQARIEEDTGWEGITTYLYRDRPVEDLLVAARNQCCLCKLYLDTTSAERLRRLVKNRFVSSWIDRKGTSLNINGDLLCQLQPLEDLEGSLPTLTLAPSTQSDLTSQFISRRLLECLTSHSRCCASHISDFLPTRLIDVGYHILSKVQLFESKEISKTEKLPPYVTLSHSWRTGNPTKLLSSNLEQFRERIREDTLSKTFRDAMAVTRNLGFRYLWIDSLCIIQDSLEDWHREAALMRDVYRGGICNLAATAASYENQGLFTLRDPSAISPLILPLGTKDGIKPFLCFQGDLWFDDVANAALNRRGWVLQERLLSPRTIYFSSQIYWECRTLRSAEMCAGRLPEFWVMDVNNPEYHNKLWRPIPGHSPEASDNDWRKLVIEYSRCQLTKEDDKLVALSGLAKEYQISLEDEYICGLWRKTLYKDVCWSPSSEKYANEGLTFQPKHYRAPSWSWAAYEGVIGYPIFRDPPEVPLWTITEISVTPYTEDRTGQISAASLTVIGSIRKLTVEISNKSWAYNLAVQMDIEETREQDDLNIEEMREQDDFDLFVLPVLSLGAPDNKEFFGLIIQPVDEVGCDFKRVGLFHQPRSRSGGVSGMEWNHVEQRWASEINEGIESERRTIRLI